jgi:hypothetical protein
MIWNVATGAGTTAQVALDQVVPRNMGISTGRVTEPDEVAELIAARRGKLANPDASALSLQWTAPNLKPG